MHIIHRVGYVFLRVVNDYSAFDTLKKRETAVNANTMQIAPFDCQWPLLVYILTVNGLGSPRIWLTSRNHQNKKQ